MKFKFTGVQSNQSIDQKETDRNHYLSFVEVVEEDVQGRSLYGEGTLNITMTRAQADTYVLGQEYEISFNNL